jgi:hypothetical protein
MKKLSFILIILFPFVVCAQQSRDKSYPLDFAWKYVGNEGFTYGGIWWQDFYMSLAFNPSGQPYLAITDWVNEAKLTVMKFDGTSWVNVGNTGFSSGEAVYISLAFDSSGQPFVAFRDVGNFGKATVMKFDGTTWVNVGNAGFSAGAAWFTSLAFSPSDQPYLAYGDDGNSRKARVMKFDGTNWINVGNAGFSAGMANYTSLAFSPTGQPSVAYQDHLANDHATVMKFDGTSWANVGNVGFSAGEAVFTSLAFSPSDGQPYVAYQDFYPANYLKATVMKFDGTNWVNVGNAGFSAGDVAHPKLAFSQAGEPFVAYGDGANSGRATVMKFDGTTWLNVGNAGFSGGGEVWENSLAFSLSGEPYFAYKECSSINDSCVVNVMKYDSVFVGIKESQKSGLLLFPNPASHSVTIDFTNIHDKIISIEIYDTRGLKLFEANTIKDTFTLSLEKIPAGIYFVQLKTTNADYFSKFCKN